TVVKRRVNLIDVTDAVKLDSVVANVPDLQRCGAVQRPLDIQIPVDDVRCPQILRHGKDVTGRRRAIDGRPEDWSGRGPIQTVYTAARNVNGGRRNVPVCAGNSRRGRRRYHINSSGGCVIYAVLA